MRGGFLRFVIYCSLVLLLVVAAVIKKETKQQKEKGKAVSVINEWYEKGFGVDVERVVRQNFQIHIKATARFVSPKTLECYLTPAKAQYLSVGNKFKSLNTEYEITGTVRDIYELTDIGFYGVRLVVSGSVQTKIPNQSLISVQIASRTYSNVIVVPNDAIVQLDNQFFVWILNNDKVFLQKVILGHTDGFKTIVESGLKDSDYVVIKGLSRLKEGIKVRVHKCDSCIKS